MNRTNLSRRDFIRVTAVGAAAFVLSACAQATPNAASLPAPAIAQVDDAFHATDPAVVNLAAGRPQLVEFYAVWWGGDARVPAVMRQAARNFQSLEMEYSRNALRRGCARPARHHPAHARHTRPVLGHRVRHWRGRPVRMESQTPIVAHA